MKNLLEVGAATSNTMPSNLMASSALYTATYPPTEDATAVAEALWPVLFPFVDMFE